ncbi:hypothetical protein BKI51_15200 [Alphaproteobacteria bacterium AO1-B]|nr:hypothetical protein BKI51_15200 [Alphaproteobacteria bacterium AO1-B]
MFFLLRTAFWLTLVLVLIPIGSETKSTPVEPINPVSAFIAAQATMSDIGGFCDRNPQACETGGNALTAIGSRARDGARIVYEYLDTQIADADPSETVITGSTNVQPTSDQTSTAGAQTANGVTETTQIQESVIGPTPRPKPRSGDKT